MRDARWGWEESNRGVMLNSESKNNDFDEDVDDDDDDDDDDGIEEAYDEYDFQGVNFVNDDRVGRSSGSKSSTSYERLAYVCRVLDVLDRSSGSVPPQLDMSLDKFATLASSSSSSAAAQRAAAAAAAAAATNEQPLELTPERCFHLLAVVGMNITASKANFWALWAFVNGMYFQLQSLFGASATSDNGRITGLSSSSQIFPIWIEQSGSSSCRRRRRRRRQRWRLSRSVTEARTTTLQRA